MIKKILSIILTACFLFQQAGFGQTVSGVAPAVPLPVDSFRPSLLRGVRVEIDTGAFALSADTGDAGGQDDTAALLTYFKTGLSLPGDSFWVNLRPDGAGRMLDPVLDGSEVARVLLEADVQLKKDLAAMTDPGTPSGRKYWQNVYARAESLFGPQEVLEIPTMTRPWIVPGEILVGEAADRAFVFKAVLNVLVQEDYLETGDRRGFADSRMQQLNEYAAEQVRQQIIPRLTVEVNSSRRYAALRQVFSALILAQWVKERFPGRAFDFSGSAAAVPAAWSKADYFKKYRESFERGEYNKTETVRHGQQLIVRQYACGGIEAFMRAGQAMQVVPMHRVQQFISRLPGLVALPEVKAQTSLKPDAGARDGGEHTGVLSAEDIDTILADAIGERSVSRAREAAGSGSYLMFQEIIQSIPGLKHEQFRSMVDDLVSLIGSQAVAECLYSDAIGLGMLLQRLTDDSTRTFFYGLISFVGIDAVRLALLKDAGSFVDGVLDRADDLGYRTFTSVMEELFGTDGKKVAAGMLARADGWFEETVEQMADPQRASLVHALTAEFGRQAVIDALLLAAEDFGNALFAGDAAALKETVIHSAELRSRVEAMTLPGDDRGFVRNLEAAARETDVRTAASALDDLFRFRTRLYPDNAGVVPLDHGRPVLVVPDLHSRAKDLLVLLQQKDDKGVSYLEEVLDGRLQLLLLGDLVHSEVSSRWRSIEAEMRKGDDTALREEITDGLAAVRMVLMLKARRPDSVHWLRGNHDAVLENARKYTDLNGGESSMVREWLEENLGEAFVDRYARLEKALPLMAVGNGFIASHSEPGIRLRRTQIEEKSEEAAYALTWARTEGVFTRDLLKEMLDTEAGVYIAGHTPQPEGIKVLKEQGLIICNDQSRLQSLLVDGTQVIHDRLGPVWRIGVEEAGLSEQDQPPVSHSFVNEYIAGHLPDDPAAFPFAQGYGVQARVIPVPGLLENCGQFAHIGLGRQYGVPVIYADAAYSSDQTVLGHELFEISQWEEFRGGLKLEPEQMRGWIKRHFSMAREMAQAWHGQAPSLAKLSEAAGISRDEPFDDPYAGEQDINLGAQATLDEFYYLRHALTDMVTFEDGALSVYQEAGGITYRGQAVSRLPVNTSKAIARMYRHGYGYGRLVTIYIRRDIPVTDDLVIALAQIAEGYHVRDDRPLPSYQKNHQRRISALQREDPGKVFGKNRVLVNGRYYYTRAGKLQSAALEGVSVLESQAAMKRLMRGEKLNGVSIDALHSRVNTQARAVQNELRQQRAQQDRAIQGQTTLDDFSATSGRDGGKEAGQPAAPGGIDLRKLSARRVSVLTAFPAGSRRMLIEQFLSQCTAADAQQLRGCLEAGEVDNSLASVFRILKAQESAAEATPAGLVAVLVSLASLDVPS